MFRAGTSNLITKGRIKRSGVGCRKNLSADVFSPPPEVQLPSDIPILLVKFDKGLYYPRGGGGGGGRNWFLEREEIGRDCD